MNGPCPKCGNETWLGYGLAGGGGIGPYVFCTICDYLEKFQDPEMEESPDASEIRSDTGPINQGGPLDQTGKTKGGEDI